MKMHPTAGRVTETDPCAVAQSHPAPALAVTVEIGADDIEQGHMAKCRSCPTARAANRATGRFCDAGGSSGRCTPTRQRSSSPGATAISRGPWAAGTALPRLSTKSTGRPLAPGPTTCPTAPAISSACRPSTAPAERPTGETPTGSPVRRRPLHPRENTHDPPDAN